MPQALRRRVASVILFYEIRCQALLLLDEVVKGTLLLLQVNVISLVLMEIGVRISYPRNFDRIYDQGQTYFRY